MSTLLLKESYNFLYFVIKRGILHIVLSSLIA